jgi:hypothetical protein
MLKHCGTTVYSDTWLGETTEIDGQEYRYDKRTIKGFTQISRDGYSSITLTKTAYQYEPVTPAKKITAPAG